MRQGYVIEVAGGYHMNMERLTRIGIGIRPMCEATMQEATIYATPEAAQQEIALTTSRGTYNVTRIEGTILGEADRISAQRQARMMNNRAYEEGNRGVTYRAEQVRRGWWMIVRYDLEMVTT